MAMKHLALKVNGDKHEVLVGSTETLADVLRDKLGLTGTRLFCNEGECGACTVLLDGKATLSCMTLALDAEGKEIMTIEGLADPKTHELHPLQKTFVEKSGMQCGVCIPGMILTAKAFLDENPEPTEDEVREAISGNLCRCGNYRRITECILDAAEIMREERANA